MNEQHYIPILDAAIPKEVNSTDEVGQNYPNIS